MTEPKIYLQIIIICITGTIIGLAVNFLRSDSIPLIAIKKEIPKAKLEEVVRTLKPTEPSAMLSEQVEKQTLTESTNPPIQLIDITVAKKLFDRDVIFIDARDETEFRELHIKGAIYGSSPVEIADRLGTLDEPVITYCEGEECELSLRLAESLQDFGFSKIYVFEGGLPSWKKANFPVESSEEE